MAKRTTKLFETTNIKIAGQDFTIDKYLQFKRELQILIINYFGDSGFIYRRLINLFERNMRKEDIKLMDYFEATNIKNINEQWFQKR